MPSRVVRQVRNEHIGLPRLLARPLYEYMPLEEGDGPCFGTPVSSSQWGGSMTHNQDQIAEGRSREPRERAQIPQRGTPTRSRA